MQVQHRLPTGNFGQGVQLPDLTPVQWPKGPDVMVPHVDSALSPINEEEFIDNSRDISGEVAGNIHRPEFDKFWRDSLKPNLWTARIRAEGYKLSFKDNIWPAEYWENNNKSALDNKDFTC